jgi:predicted patatin/cPLA2 family phospholipase
MATMATELYGKQPAEVIALLNRRRQANFVAGQDQDGARVALIVEGGAMRGAISSGTVDALYQLGYGTCFEEVWGNSAGALNGAYFVSGQITLGTTVYYENATDPTFINLWNWPDPLAVEWLINNWIAAGKPLDIAAVMRSSTDLYIAATNADTGEPRFFSNRENRPEIMMPALQASCSVPLFVTKKVVIDGAPYNDGLVQAGIPLGVPARRCTHIVAALTRSVGYRKKYTKLIGFLENLVLRGYSKEYLRRYHARHIGYNAALDALLSGEYPPRSLIIAPSPSETVIKNGENRPGPLKRAVGESMARVERIFGALPGTVRHYRDAG